MKQQIRDRLVKSKNLTEIKEQLLGYFKEVRKESDQLGYVSGIISSDGIENIPKNVAILAKYTKNLRKANSFPIFSATDIFSDQVFKKIDAFNLPVEDFLNFWRAILESGFITDIYMTPRWKDSTGAKDEFETAKKQGLKIHYVGQ